MRSYSWLGLLCRRPLLLSTVVDRGDGLRKISSFSDRLLNSCGYSISKPPDFGTTEIQLIKRRYIHATGSCSAKERSFYEILGVSENASREDIKTAFHLTLQDSEKRAQYDAMRTGGFNYGADSAEGYGADDAGGFRYAYRTNFSNSFHKIFSEIFEDEANHFASDIQVDLVLSFSESARGCTKHVTFDAYVPCDSCDGRGYPANAKASICPTCRGVGKVTIPPFTSTCSHCRGLGRIIKEHWLCWEVLLMMLFVWAVVAENASLWFTMQSLKETLSIKHDVLRFLRGFWEIRSVCQKLVIQGGRGSRSGNLFINLKVADDPVFVREGADVFVDANISFTQAILGGKVEVPTLSGKTQVNIPKGVQPGQLVVLRGKGLSKHGFLVHHGDQYVRFCINFPTAINERQRAILEEFTEEEINNQNDTSNEGTWWQQLLEGVMDRSLLRSFSFLSIEVMYRKDRVPSWGMLSHFPSSDQLCPILGPLCLH
ncbi:hypothetical protein OIU78_020279 [Salix suchowensis]|nr:hypothetical protein OIU78_020279 [Salix suchowensis]